MTDYYTAMGFVRILFFLLVGFYLIQHYCRKKKLSWFQLTVVWSILVMQLAQAVYQIMWNGEVTDDCETQSRNVEAAIDSAMYLIGILVSYFMFRTVNLIYNFSVRGNLPKEIQRKRMLRCIIVMVAQSCFFCLIYVTLNEMISEMRDFMNIGRLT